MVVIYTKVYILPIIVFIWFPVTFLVTYTIALSVKDIVVFMPYISDTGTYSPESCVFGQMLNTGSILIAVVMYIRYRHLQEQSNFFHFAPSIERLNSLGLWLGITATFGVSLVGNFQETNMFSIHMMGASMAFGLGTVYQIVQTLICIKVYPKMGSKHVNYYRIAISGCCFISSIITLVFAGISLVEFDGEDITKWTPKHAGYKAHVISAIAEWITVTLTMGYICTFTHEFRKVIVYEPEIEHTHEGSIHEYSTNNSDSINRY